MHLSALARDIKERHTQPSFIELGFDEQLSLLIDKEWHRRRERRTADLIKAANFCYNNASVQELDYSVERGLTKKQINEFAECSYITSGHNIIIMHDFAHREFAHIGGFDDRAVDEGDDAFVSWSS